MFLWVLWAALTNFSRRGSWEPLPVRGTGNNLGLAAGPWSGWWSCGTKSVESSSVSMSELSWILGHPAGTWQLLVSMRKLPQVHIGIGSRNHFCLMPQISGLCWPPCGKVLGEARGCGARRLVDALPGLPASTPVLTLKHFCLFQLPNQVLLPQLWWQRHRRKSTN